MVAISSHAATLCLADADPVVVSADDSPAPGAGVDADVICSSLPGTATWGSEDPAGTGDFIAAFSVGTDACNIGDVPLGWHADTADHAVIRQGMFRLMGGRFEHIGTSWVKHGFLATNEDHCGLGCAMKGPPYTELRPGCSDLYTAQLNGDRAYLGPTSEINAFTGAFPADHERPVGTGAIKHRLQVRHTDLDPELNPGALYFVDGHYIHPADASAGNAENNASHRLGVILPFNCQPGACLCAAPFCLKIDPLGSTEVGRPAIRAWKDRDATVRETDARVPGEGLFILAAKVTDQSNGYWRYEYALYNLNSHRSAGSFRVPIPEDALVQNIGFHDVHHHSGEPWGTDDWTATVETDSIVWATAPYAVNPNANALRWSTLYNFRFEVNAPPGESAVEVGLFRPGFPDVIAIRTDGPQLSFIDCNDNDIADLCDVSCAPLGCAPETCGQVEDCNDNGVPDECEFDCNDNGIPDECDIRDCPPQDLSCGDCNENTVPDGCEDDCDEDGIPDTCEETLDADDDGFDDCVDECPYNTPPNGCNPPQVVTCRYSTGLCVSGISRAGCISQGGIPVCGDPGLPCQFLTPCPVSRCRDGCLIGDLDLDGDVDLYDVSGFQMCFSSFDGTPAFVPPTTECITRFDFDNDSDVDLEDFVELIQVLGEP